MGIQAPPGVFDIVPEDSKNRWKESYLWAHVENVMKEMALLYGFKEIRTPIFEKTELFCRSVGEATDIVSKEMYTFKDRGERDLTLRPEGTAAVLRAVIENKLLDKQSLKLFYIGPMFRYERAQAGRFRQFHQFGIEAFGNGSPEQDAEIIDLAYSLYVKLGVKGLKVKLGSLGNKESRNQYRSALIEFLQNHLTSLSEESRIRFEKNPLRILDSKDEKDQEILKEAPSLLNFLSSECVAHFEGVKNALTSLDIPFEVDDRLVRGLDYYQKTVFEIISSDLGAHNTLCGGGRYDGLLKELGGPDLPCTGFAIGIERTLQVMLKQEVALPPKESPVLYVIPMGEKGRKEAFKLVNSLRRLGLKSEMHFEEGKVGKGFAKASDLGSRYALALGERELETGTLEIKDLISGNKHALPLASLPQFLQNDHL